MQQMDAYSYMIQNRQMRINQNNKRIISLWDKLNSDIKYQKCLKLIELFEQKQTRIENQLQIQEQKYQENYKEQKFLSIGNQIQLIAETIAEKEEKIELTSMMLEVMKKEKINKIRLFQKWYERRKQIMQEEFDKKASIGTEFIYFIKIYHSIRSKQEHFSTSITEQEKLQLLLDHYQMIKESLVSKKEQKEEYFVERRNFIYSYLKLRSQSNREMQKIISQLSMLKPKMESILENRNKIEQEIQILEQLNQAYIDQVQKLNEVSIDEKAPVLEKRVA